MTFPYMYVVLLIIFTPVTPLPLPALLSPQNFFFSSAVLPHSKCCLIKAFSGLRSLY